MFRNNESDAAIGAAESDGKHRAKLHDKQSERDYRELRIDKVGVRGLRFPIQVRDKARALQNTIATIGMYVDLPKEFKGTHMSRFIEVLNAHGNVIHVAGPPAGGLARLKRVVNSSSGSFVNASCDQWFGKGPSGRHCP